MLVAVRVLQPRLARTGESAALVSTMVAVVCTLALAPLAEVGLWGTFGMAVMVHDPYVQANVIEAAGDYRSVPDFEAVLGETDVLTVHMPLGADSRGLIGAAELAALPAHAFVINAARGGIIDETALHDALTSGKIAGAGLDVFDQEPPPENHPLFALDNVILSPHSAGLSKEAAIRMAISTAKNVLAGIDGKLDPRGRQPRGALRRGRIQVTTPARSEAPQRSRSMRRPGLMMGRLRPGATPICALAPAARGRRRSHRDCDAGMTTFSSRPQASFQASLSPYFPALLAKTRSRSRKIRSSWPP